MVPTGGRAAGSPGWRPSTPVPTVRPGSTPKRSSRGSGDRSPMGMSFDLDFCLRHLIEQGGSDLHLKVPAPPVIRIDGQMHPIEGLPVLTPEDTERAVLHMLDDPPKLEEFAKEYEVDFAYSIP